MEHAFFVGMNGFVESDGELCDQPEDPKDVIRFAAVERDDIMDKSKSDVLNKTIVFGQILWFIIQFAARSHRTMNGTTHLEVLTVAIAALSCLTSWCWRFKPLDVQRPIILPLQVQRADLRPRLIRQASFSRSLPSKYLSRATCSGFISNDVEETFLKRIVIKRIIENHAYTQETILVFVTTIFGGIHCLAWNYPFPTEVEMWMWRILTADNPMDIDNDSRCALTDSSAGEESYYQWAALFRCHGPPLMMTAVPRKSECAGLESHMFWTGRSEARRPGYGRRIHDSDCFGDAFWDEGAPCIACLRPEDDDGGTMHDPGVNEQHMAYLLLSVYTFVSSQADSRFSAPSFMPSRHSDESQFYDESMQPGYSLRPTPYVRPLATAPLRN
ncbi:hypothetical protein BDZ89DRAFT_1158847 [Hymenopellis radicata]|nr:hypothetical protein BDZ89DRAFT_1158847 [Hymenopellis radicata]